MFKVTFINIPSREDSILTSYPPVGILSMAACLKNAGYAVDFIDADVNALNPSQVMELLRPSSPGLIGISLNVSQVCQATKYITEISNVFPDIPVVLGGPYVTGVDEKIFDDFPQIKYAVIGEGEYAIIDLVNYILGKQTINQVRNLVCRSENHVIKNKRERILDLNSLPIPDYSLVKENIHKYLAPEPSIASPSVAIMCSRGCPYNCTFCSSPHNWGRKTIYKSTNSVINEIMYLKELFNVQEIFFQDDTLNARPKWFFDLCNKIIANGLNKNTFFKCPFRVNKEILNDELLKKAKEANFWMIFYGVENGNQEMLNTMNKNITVAEIIRAFKLTKKHGIATYASFMIGNFGETQKTVKDSIKLMKKIAPDYGGFAIAAPFPGSKLYDLGNQNNLIIDKNFKNYQFGDCILRTHDLSVDDIVKLHDIANRKFKDLHTSLKYKLQKKSAYADYYLHKGIYPSEFWHVEVNRTSKNVSMRIPKFINQNAQTIFMKILADHPKIEDNPLKIKFTINGSKHSLTISDNEWKVISFPLSNTIGKEIIKVKWIVNRTWNPSKLRLNNDDRELGLTIEKIWLE